LRALKYGIRELDKPISNDAEHVRQTAQEVCEPFEGKVRAFI
jgi:hypothetical protein